MSTIKNFMAVIRRFRLPFALNILGLGIALAVAALIFMQLRHDLTFDPGQPRRQDICLLVSDYRDEGEIAVSPRPFVPVISRLPGVEAVCLTEPFSTPVFAGNGDNPSVPSVKSSLLKVDEGFDEVFCFDFLEGAADPLAAENSVMIPKSLADKLFPEGSAVNRTLMSDDSELTVTGVYMDFPKNSSLQNAIYLCMDKDTNMDRWGSCDYNIFVRLAPGTDKAAFADLLFRELSEIKNNNGVYNGIYNSLSLHPLDKLHFEKAAMFDNLPKASRSQLLVFLSIAILTVAIACINLTNFNTALAPLRIKSINTMKVLGSTRSALCRGIIVESLATGIAAWLVAIMLVFIVRGTPAASLIDPEISLSGQYPVFAALLGTALLAGLLSGIYPAMYITSFQPALALKGNFALSPKGRRIRGVLVGLQFFISFMLLACMSVILLQNRHIRDIDPGYDNGRLLTVALDDKIDCARYGFLQEELRSIPGVENTAVASALLSSSDNIPTWFRSITGEEYIFRVIWVTPGFFETIGADIVEGRGFTDGDSRDSSRRWVFNETARDAFGLTLDDKVEETEPIVGFVNDLQSATIRQGISPTAFMMDPYGSQADILYIRTSPGSDAGQIGDAVEETLHSLLPDYPFEVQDSDAVFRKTYEKELDTAMLISVFGLITVVISLIGVFSLVTFDSQSRRKEIAVRKVMGAQTSDILSSFNLSYLKILLLCFALSVPVSVFLSERWLSQFIERIAMPWWVFIPILTVMAAVTCATVSGQCSKTAGSNPAGNLRSE